MKQEDIGYFVFTKQPKTLTNSRRLGFFGKTNDGVHYQGYMLETFCGGGPVVDWEDKERARYTPDQETEGELYVYDNEVVLVRKASLLTDFERIVLEQHKIRNISDDTKEKMQELLAEIK